MDSDALSSLSNAHEASPSQDSLSATLHVRYQAVCSSIAEIAYACGRPADTVRIVAVSKTQPPHVLQAALRAGIYALGENYAQEMKEKARALPQSQVEWHFIGHLQTNKVKMIAPFVHCIHSVDSERLAKEISKAAGNLGRTIDILLQVNTSGEQSKSGCAPEQVSTLADAVLTLPHLRVRGLMTIAAQNDDAEAVRPMFRLLRSLRDELYQRYPDAAVQGAFHELSMGMSGDYPVAIQEGATILRIGTAIFGERHYAQ
ncbi:MAG: YggS family pyridoxal phosphate-dependent enzyme [Bacteroidota bacterium]|nr:YggS family pyridoxal phosphate-dependent enzyme [Candidatus Kapabacteria bacterium]MDW8221284.1 YggS family pyridoxal phosphate-dependent enzyme [Bacteroidota bacterium]